MNSFALLSLVGCIVSWVLGIITFSQNRKNPLNIIFTLFCLASAYMGFCEFMYRQADTEETAYLWIKIQSFWPFMIAFAIHFVLLFIKKTILSNNKFLYLLIYAPALIISIIRITTNLLISGATKKYWGYTYIINEQGIYPVIAIWTMGTTFLGIILLFIYYLRTIEQKKKKQTKYIIIGFSCIIMAGSIQVLSPLFKIRMPEFTAFSMTLVCIFVGYAIKKHELFTLTLETAAENIIQTMPSGLIIINTDRYIVRVNKYLTDLLEYEENELVGKNIDMFFPDNTLKKPLLNYEALLKTKSGKEVDIIFSYLIIEKGNEVIGIIYTCRNLTELKQIQKALHDTNEKWTSLTKNTTDIIIVVNEKGIIQYINKTILPYTIDDTLGKPIYIYVPKEQHEILEKSLKKVFESGTEDNYEISSNIPQIGIIWFSTKIIPIKHEEEKPTNAIIISTDITKVKQMQIQLIQSEKLATIGQLLAGIAHELNNPLTSILGFSQLLSSNETIPEEIKIDIQTIYNEAVRCQKIVENFLIFSRRREPKREPININEVIEETIKLIRYNFNTSGIAIVTELDKNLPDIYADPHQLKQVFLNMTTNARHAMEDRSNNKLIVKTEKSDEKIRIYFIDNGYGIEEENIKNLFVPFFTTKDPGKGTGLGLSISYGIIQQHNGNISVASKKGEGTTFTIELPITTITAG